MATQQLTHTRIWSDEFGPVIDFLAQFGVGSREIADHPEDWVLRAISARGWEVQFEREPDGSAWIAGITEYRAVTQSQSAFGVDPDRMMALFRALRIALTWPSREEMAQIFNDFVQSTLNMTATKFMEKWRSDELDLNDPRVIDVLVARPLGW